MPNRTVPKSKVLLSAMFAILATVSGLASCGGASVSQTAGSGSSPATVISTTVSPYATPHIITSGSSAVITWSSANSTSCSSPQVSISGTSGSFQTSSLTTNTTYTITCVGPTGSATQSVMVAVANTPTLNAILSAANAWVNTPVRGTSYYYCDCGTGADAACKPGNDTNSGTNPLLPRRTIENAITRLNSLTGSNTIALCKGGAFNLANPSGLYVNTTCAAGSTCNDLREYSPTLFTSSAKPIVNNLPGAVYLFHFQGNVGGLRILNLKLQGINGPYGTSNEGIFLYGGHDVTMGNLDLDSFDLPVYDAGGSTGNSNNQLNGSFITNSQVIGYLGGSNNAVVSNNYWDGNGGSTMFDHTIYLSAHQALSNVSVVGNYIHGQFGSSCLGAVIVGHGMIDGLSVSNNTIEVDAAAASGGCYGLGFGSGGYAEPNYFRHATFSGNILKNTGNVSLSVATCPGCVIKNNLIIQDWGYIYPTIGIAVGDPAARTSPADDVNNANIISNNTIWFGPTHVHGALGLQVVNEGTGHIIANNTVTYSSNLTVNTWGGVNCFNYPLALTSYSFINNNHCYSAATPYHWEQHTAATLSAWLSASGFDSLSISGLPPIFINATSASQYDFHPSTTSPISPLIGKGSSIYAPTTSTDITGVNWLNPPAIGAYE